MKITIKNIEIEIKNKMRTYLIYEQITNKPFNPQSLTEMMIYLYSLILANQKDIQLTFEEFIDFLDENPNTMNEFNEWLIEESKMNSQFSDLKKKMVIE